MDGFVLGDSNKFCGEGGGNAQVMVVFIAPFPPPHWWLPFLILTLPIFREDNGSAGLEVVT